MQTIQSHTTPSVLDDREKSSKSAKSRKEKEERSRKAEEVSGTQLWLVLIKAYHSLLAFTGQTLEGSGLSDSEFRILEALLHKGPMPVNTIGQKVFLTPGSISVAVDRLLKRGLVSRTNSAQDRRIRVVDLTPAGKRLIERVFGSHAQQMDRMADVLSSKERRQMARAVKAFGKAAAQARRVQGQLTGSG